MHPTLWYNLVWFGAQFQTKPYFTVCNLQKPSQNLVHVLVWFQVTVLFDLQKQNELKFTTLTKNLTEFS